MSKPATVTAWVSKYAMTVGLYAVQGEVNNQMLIVRGKLTQYFHKGDWHLTREEAVERAETKRKRRIKSLEKSLAAARAMTFEKDAQQ